jgi:hypothetical protein
MNDITGASRENHAHCCGRAINREQKSVVPPNAQESAKRCEMRETLDVEQSATFQR